MLRLTAVTPAELARTLAADTDTLMRQAQAPGPPGQSGESRRRRAFGQSWESGASGEPGGSGAGPRRIRLGVVDPDPSRIAAARKVVARAAAAAEAGTAVPSWHGMRGVWFSANPLLLAEGARTAFVFPGLEGDFDPQVEDVARHFGLPLPELEAGDVGRHAGSVVALGRLLDTAVRRIGIAPDVVTGHSIGEWTAMTCAGLQQPAAMDQAMAAWNPDTLRVPDVQYAALGCGVQRARQALEGVEQVVLSHDNAPNQVMVAGPAGPIADLVARMRADGVIAQVLNFRSGFHTPMFQPFLPPFRVMARNLVLGRPQVPVWSATTAALYPRDDAGIRALFLRNLLEPVLFRPMIMAMHDAGMRVFVQLGAGQLSSLIDDTLADRPHLAIPALTRKRSGLDQLLQLATALWVEGAEPNLDALSPVAASPIVHAAAPRLTSVPHPIRTPAPASGAAPAPAGFPRVARFDTARMPWLLDHAFFRQRSGWPDLEDRRPIMPATTLVASMMRWAEEVLPGRHVVAVRDVRLRRWVAAAPPSEIKVEAVESAPDEVQISVGEHCTGVVDLAVAYPRPPERWAPDPTERASSMRARTLYDERVMFHGPAFQGIVELSGLGDHSVRGSIRVGEAPGALMDNVGQLIGAWIDQQPGEGGLAFPVRMDRIRFFAPEPAPGEVVEAVVRVTTFEPDQVVADAQLTHRGRLLATVEGWGDRRFLADPVARLVFRAPDRRTQSVRQPGGWVMVADHWHDLTTRELIAGLNLSTAERNAFESMPPRGRRGWLLGRIAVKDAVRQYLWAQDGGPVFPAEVFVSNEPSGRPVVAGLHGLRLPPLAVSLAHSGELAVAVVRPAQPGRQDRGSGVDDETGPGIDLEQVVDRPPSTVDAAFGPAERRLLAEAVARTVRTRDTGRTGDTRQAGDAGRTAAATALWFARFWTAKEAVAKARGTGLQGRPHEFAVVSATPTLLEVVAPGGRRYRVRSGRLDNPPGLPTRQYVVAWTTGPDDDRVKEPHRP